MNYESGEVATKKVHIFTYDYVKNSLGEKDTIPDGSIIMTEV